jgi:hypothetical protein
MPIYDISPAPAYGDSQILVYGNSHIPTDGKSPKAMYGNCLVDGSSHNLVYVDPPGTFTTGDRPTNQHQNGKQTMHKNTQTPKLQTILGRGVWIIFASILVGDLVIVPRPRGANTMIRVLRGSCESPANAILQSNRLSDFRAQPYQLQDV